MKQLTNTITMIKAANKSRFILLILCLFGSMPWQSCKQEEMPAGSSFFCIGVNIGAQTPAEIAIAIAAELISVRATHSAAGSHGASSLAPVLP